MEQRARTLMDTSINSLFGRIHPQGVGRRVPRYCVATLSLAVSRARSFLCVAVIASATGTARPPSLGWRLQFDFPGSFVKKPINRLLTNLPTPKKAPGKFLVNAIQQK